jgi:hypothetical protein
MIPINLALLNHIDKEVDAAIRRGEKSATIWLSANDNIGAIRQILLARKFSVVVTNFDKMEIFW